ncbi:uncharacterized protein [Antedon mediterranea]|uniref:uncharacterized protein n=1 Tax=Antedon mediterranea TaxID=105859 RepID=UPI003AF7DD39
MRCDHFEIYFLLRAHALILSTMNLTAVLLFVTLLVGSCSGLFLGGGHGGGGVKSYRKYAAMSSGGRGSIEAIGLQMARDQRKIDQTSANCWLRPIGKRYPRTLFQLSCSEDGVNYFDKQCSEDRCWCLDSDGNMVEEGGRDGDGYHYKIADGLSLRCPKRF